jgi:septal ring factor EnvC (AmiA/AmiB activator)
LNQTLKEYEEQLLQAQQHIIYLENSRQTEENQTLESEVTNLRNTIARYTEHLEQVDLERQKFEESLHQKELENSNLVTELNKLHGYLEELQVMNEKLAAQETKLAEQIDNSNMVDRESYYELLVMYGKK